MIKGKEKKESYFAWDDTRMRDIATNKGFKDRITQNTSSATLPETNRVMRRKADAFQFSDAAALGFASTSLPSKRGEIERHSLSHGCAAVRFWGPATTLPPQPGQGLSLPWTP
eukprot:TRINITY_DN8217_c0_g1_i6.p1 TRINITY_DN8217_c0_g1~~TRINITY_DN8217_c0_g1_i6.p1  ORF type:complete len:113 (+),score=20.05 TRINITY_DN8217_c0_g1_i6:193-531(+)